MKGSEFCDQIRHLPRIPDREEAIYQAVATGYIIAWPFVPVTMPNGNVISVSSDYMAIGEPDDYVRIAGGLTLARKVYGLLGYRLPTVEEVDAIWKASDVKLKPQPWSPPPGVPRTEENQCGVDLLQLHNHWVDVQLAGRTGLVAGHKKDTVEDPTLLSHHKKIAIYGWHQANGVPIQPLFPSRGSAPNVGHEDTYHDYSQGYRFVLPL